MSVWNHRNRGVLTRDAAHTNCLLQLIGKEWAYLASEIRGSKGLNKSYICRLCYLALDNVVAFPGADAGIFEGGVTTGGGCGRGMCPLPREARKLLKS